LLRPFRAVTFLQTTQGGASLALGGLLKAFILSLIGVEKIGWVFELHA
jgi:hypothetical protein